VNEEPGTDHDGGYTEEDDGDDESHNAPFDRKRQFSRTTLWISPTRISRDGRAWVN
jgi:hypothetical protein